MKQHDDMIAEFKIDVDSHPGGYIESYGAGIVNTPYDTAYIGRGRSEQEAAVNALEMMAQCEVSGSGDKWAVARISEAIEELSPNDGAACGAEADCYAEFLKAEGLEGDDVENRQRFYDLSDETFELSAALYVRFGPPDSKEEALARFLDVGLDDVSETTYGTNTYDAGGLGEYIVCNDGEADAAVRLYIEDSLWAFRPEFLAAYVPNGVDTDVLQTIQEARCEDCNDAIRAMVDAGRGFDTLVSDAIGADGRGHFLAGYDSSEGEAIGPDGGALFIYRVN